MEKPTGESRSAFSLYDKYQSMKRCLLLLLMFYAITIHAQAPWPRNKQTGKIEFEGIIPWPAADVTEAQRRVLVRRWYESKLTDVKLAQLSTWSTQPQPTCCNLPGKAWLDYRRTDYYGIYHGFRLNYKVQLTPTAKGLTYRLSDFECGWWDDDVGGSFAFETMPYVTGSNLAYPMFRKKIAAALAGW